MGIVLEILGPLLLSVIIILIVVVSVERESGELKLISCPGIILVASHGGISVLRRLRTGNKERRVVTLSTCKHKFSWIFAISLELGQSGGSG